MELGTKASLSLACLYEIQQTCKFAKTGQNSSGGRYSYYKLEDLSVPAKPFLSKYKCIVLFSTSEEDVSADFLKLQGSKDVAPKDKLVTKAFAVVTARIQSIEDVEDYVQTRCFGYKVDQTADKALGAYTVGARYALMEMYDVEGDIDPDSDQDDVRGNDLMAMVSGPKPATAPAATSTDDLFNMLGGIK